MYYKFIIFLRGQVNMIPAIKCLIVRETIPYTPQTNLIQNEDRQNDIIKIQIPIFCCLYEEKGKKTTKTSISIQIIHT